MKIMLISSNLSVLPEESFPAGMCIVGAALRRAGHDVVLFDFLRCAGDYESLVRAVRESGAELFGISIRNIDNVDYLAPEFYIDDVKEIIARIRSCSKSPVFLGGSGFSLMPEEILEYTGGDYGIAGAGEASAVMLADALASGKTPDRRIIHSEQGAFSFGGLDYDRDLLSWYLSFNNVIPVHTKRGCPKKCVYCSYPRLEGCGVRMRPDGELIGDLEFFTREYPRSIIYFTDSVFNDDKKLFLGLLESVVRRGLKIRWRAFFTPQVFSDDEMILIKRSGVETPVLGIDALTDTTLDGLGKGYDFDTAVRSVESFRKHGIDVSASVIACGPGETMDTLRESAENMNRLNGLPVFIFMGIRILPGAAIEKIALREGVIKKGQSLLKPVFYISPNVAADDAYNYLCSEAKRTPGMVFPPQEKGAMLRKLRIAALKNGISI